MHSLIILYYLIGILFLLCVIVTEKEDVLNSLREDGLLIVIITSGILVVLWPACFVIGMWK